MPLGTLGHGLRNSAQKRNKTSIARDKTPKPTLPRIMGLEMNSEDDDRKSSGGQSNTSRRSRSKFGEHGKAALSRMNRNSIIVS